jgi:hypothetical protein
MAPNTKRTTVSPPPHIKKHIPSSWTLNRKCQITVRFTCQNRTSDFRHRMFQVMLLAPVIFWWFLGFWKNYGHLISLLTASVSHHKLPGLFLTCDTDMRTSQLLCLHTILSYRSTYHILTFYSHEY